MENTETAINELLDKMKEWGMFDSLTEREKQSIEIDLRYIAGSAIMDANQKIKDIIPELYNSIMRLSASGR